MTIASVSLGIYDDAPVDHGFWISSGATLPKGPMLTLSPRLFSAFSSGISLIFGFTLVRLVQILSFFIFRHAFERTKYSMQESQYAAMIVNVKQPLAMLLASWEMRCRGATQTWRHIVTVASILLLAQLAIPPIVSTFPIVEQALAQSYGCEIPSLASDGSFLLQDNTTYDPNPMWADAAFPLLEGSPPYTSKKLVKKSAPTLPPLNTTYNRRCPAGVTCHPTYQFTVSNRYSLRSRDFGFNTNLRFSLEVLETCYRPPDAIAPLNPNLSGLLYGQRNSMNSFNSNATDIFYIGEASFGSYGLTSYAARANDFVQTDWKPNASLVLGGDTTILFYRVGGVLMKTTSDDPIFATGPLQSGLPIDVYNSSSIVSPILCDTKYVFCTNKRDCSPSGGISSLRNWMGKKGGEEWKELAKFFTVTLFSPPIYMASKGHDAIFASRSVSIIGGRRVQSSPKKVNITLEIARLSKAGLVMVASNPQLTTYGFWSSSDELHAQQLSLCGKSIIDHQNVVTIYLVPYIAVLSLSIVITALSFPQYTLHHIWNWKEYEDAWMLYEVGQLHRQMLEQVGGPLENVDSDASWPSVNDGPPGLVIVNENGTKRFGSAFSAEKDSSAMATFGPSPLNLAPTY